MAPVALAVQVGPLVMAATVARVVLAAAMAVTRATAGPAAQAEQPH